MAPFTTEQWLVLGLLAAVGTLAMLHALATRIRNESRIHDHLIECARVRDDYVRMTQANQRKAVDNRDIEIVDA